MAEAVLMPKLGMTMEKGKIISWLVKEGDIIAKGDPIVEVETDKVNLEVESLQEGYLLKIIAREGDEIPVNQAIAYLGAKGEHIPVDNMRNPVEKTSHNIKEPPAEAPREMAEQLGQLAVTGAVASFDTDLLVIGGGPGGYTAAIRAAQLGVKVKLVEKDQVGGTCLNRGCIPTKALAASAERWRQVKNAKDMGILVKDPFFDWGLIQQRKDQIVSQLVRGVQSLLKKNRIELLQGEARLVDGHTVEIVLSGGQIITQTARYILLATGTTPAQASFEKGQGVEILTTDEFLQIEDIPKSMAVIGGGVIGVELTSVCREFGAEVSVIEIMPRILPMVDEEIAIFMQKNLHDAGVQFYTGTGVKKVSQAGGMQRVELEDGSELLVERVLMAVGRKPETASFLKLGLRTNSKGYLEVNDRFQSSIESILAVGDITGGMQLAHVAMAQAIIAVETCFEHKKSHDLKVVPACIFTHPEIAYVGLTEEQVKSRNIPYQKAKFPFAANGKALASGSASGFVKIICDSRWKEILGVHIVGPEAASLISEGALAIKMEGTSEELASTIHAHPTFSEAVMETAAGILGKAIHI